MESDALAYGWFSVICLVMILDCCCWCSSRLPSFLPGPVHHIVTDNQILMGEITRSSTYLPDAHESGGSPAVEVNEKSLERRLLRTGNFDLGGNHYEWVNSAAIQEESFPKWALVVERLSWGRFYGFPKAFLIDAQPVADTPEAVWERFNQYHAEVRQRWHQRRDLETTNIGRVNHELEQARLQVRKMEIKYGSDSPQTREAQQEMKQTQVWATRRLEEIQTQISRLNAENARYQLVLETAQGQEKIHTLDEIVRACPANQLTIIDQTGIYLSRWLEFLTEAPREANSEGGVYPAIFGTVAMTLIMSVLVVPFGVLAALYLREYARQVSLSVQFVLRSTTWREFPASSSGFSD